MLGTALLLVLSVQAGVDTIVIDVSSALDRALESAPELISANFRVDAARASLGQSEAWPNLNLTVNAENLGRQEELSGLSGFEGTEGQAVFSTALPLGWERAGAVAGARAAANASEATARLARQDVAGGALIAIGRVLRDQIFAANAREEYEALTQLTEVLALQAREGRAADGDAARAILANGLAATRRARREAALAESATDLARRLGYPAEVTLHVDAPSCSAVLDSGSEEAPRGTLPELDLANSRAAMADAAVTVAKGIRAPDLTPQFGLRRAGGLNALYLGIATTIPLFDRGSDRIVAAEAERQAAAIEVTATEALLAAHAASARQRLNALSEGGRGFTATWFDALERTVTAAQARYDLGEGTLFELLDSRRARLEALDDYAAWQAEWWQSRVVFARLQGREPSATSVCVDPFRETP